MEGLRYPNELLQTQSVSSSPLSYSTFQSVSPTLATSTTGSVRVVRSQEAVAYIVLGKPNRRPTFPRLPVPQFATPGHISYLPESRSNMTPSIRIHIKRTGAADLVTTTPRPNDNI
jgi:hypothetical protein